MDLINENIQLISAPSILGLRLGGVEDLSESLLVSGLVEALKTKNAPMLLETLNDQYNNERDRESNVLNPKAIKSFSNNWVGGILIS